MDNNQLNNLWQEYQATQQPQLDINALWNEYQTTQSPAVEVPAQSPMQTAGIPRVIARTGRSLATGAGLVADLPIMAINALDKLNPMNAILPQNDRIDAAKNNILGTLPSENIKNFIDTNTDNTLQPQNGYERTGDFLGELMTAAPEALPAAARIPSKAVNAILPKVDEGLKESAQLAQKYNIPLSLDQISNSKALKNVQKVSQELPFSGQSGFRQKQMEAFNRELLKTVDIKGNRFSPKVINEAFDKVGAEFDNFGKGKTFNLGGDFLDNLTQIETDASQIVTKDALGNFQKTVGDIFSNIDSKGNISGEKLSAVRANISRLSRKASNPEVKDLLRDIENNIVDTMTSNDVVAKSKFGKTKQKYKNLLALEGSIGKSGNINPNKLHNRVSKVYGRQYTRGEAGAIGDLARVGSELLPELGGSDTLQKAVYFGGATGGAISNPVATALTLGGNRTFQSGINRNQSLVSKVIK